MKSKISEPLNWPIFHMLVLICATATMSYHQKMFQKISILKKAFLGSSCSALVIKKFKKIPVEEFHFSEIIVLYPATLPDNELFHSHFFKVFNHNCRIVQNILRGEYQKQAIKYGRGQYHSKHYNLHMLSFRLYI